LTATRVATTTLPIELNGREIVLDAHAYQGSNESEQVIVLIHRSSEVSANSTPIVRIHSGCVTGDIFHSLRCDCYQQLQTALQVICDAPFGALVYVPYHEGRGIGLFKKLQAYALQDRGLDTIEANLAIGAPADARDYTLVSHALTELGMSKIQLLSNNPIKQQALCKLGIAVVERIPLRVPPNPHNQRYLETKRTRLAHDC
jgi:GTP cyclohydrolase II/3,4-dihydroxy 2-butanone 4-phosphate synthase/GTP cyclohydrolase II